MHYKCPYMKWNISLQRFVCEIREEHLQELKKLSLMMFADEILPIKRYPLCPSDVRKDKNGIPICYIWS